MPYTKLVYAETHECSKPEYEDVKDFASGTVWQCGTCGKRYELYQWRGYCTWDQLDDPFRFRQLWDQLVEQLKLAREHWRLVLIWMVCVGAVVSFIVLPVALNPNQ